MAKLVFLTSASLATTGTLFAVGGIVGQAAQPIGIGLVLLFASAVFSVLYLGVRRPAVVTSPIAQQDPMTQKDVPHRQVHLPPRVQEPVVSFESKSQLTTPR